MEILKKRTEIPKVIKDSSNNFRLVILPGEDKEKTTNIGRPIGSEYWDIQEKIKLSKSSTTINSTNHFSICLDSWTLTE
jgi:hypothetical protein